MFLTYSTLGAMDWRAFERAVSRLLLHLGYERIRLIGQTGDRGADLLAHLAGRRWAIQVKHWQNRVGGDVIDRTVEAARTYAAKVPAIVSLSGFTSDARERQEILLRRGIPLQLWDRAELLARAERLDDSYPGGDAPSTTAKKYQEPAIRAILSEALEGRSNRALIVMATGLGKTVVAADALRRLRELRGGRVLVLAHTNPLVYQLERSFWPFIRSTEPTVVWNGTESTSVESLAESPFVFGTSQTAHGSLDLIDGLPDFDFVLVDEAHHAGSRTYREILEALGAGRPGGPFLIGLTATPWRHDEVDLTDLLGEPLVTLDLVEGMNRGFLANVDYRMYTDNIDWDAIESIEGDRFSPGSINRTLFIHEWDDGVIEEVRRAWDELASPRAIVFCGTIDHALRMRDRINALRFCKAAAVFSGSHRGSAMTTYERNLVLSDFHDGAIDVVCAVDIFNEGVDVPDVNLLVFQRVTHSRRIFVQQLGRGLRLSERKEKVLVLDFVSDIRRFAAGLDLKDRLSPGDGTVVRWPHKVSFRRVGGEDPEAETFLRQWLDDVTTIEAAGEDASVLRFPPPVPGGRR